MSLERKYIWVIRTLQRGGHLSLEQIARKWADSTLSMGEPLSRQTFGRWKTGIHDAFGVEIRCDRTTNLYYIANPEVLERDELSSWMLQTFSTLDTLGAHVSLHDRILVDDVPSSRDHLTEILAAMRENRVCEMTYKGYHHAGATFFVSPYCVKMFKNRWYLLGQTELKGPRIYGLDRIQAFHATEERFHLPRDFDARAYFASFFGIVADTSVPEQRIVLRAHGFHQHYLRSLPLHASQREMAACEAYADFELRLRPTYDFIMEVLSRGAMLEVREPQALREEVAGWVADLAQLYENE